MINPISRLIKTKGETLHAALEKIKAGASLVQLYSGFIYSGPGLVKQINNTILSYRLNT